MTLSGRQWRPVAPTGQQTEQPKKRRSHLGNDVTEVHPDGSFTTAKGSRYQHLGGGKYSRTQNPETATTLNAPKEAHKPFANTTFVPSEHGQAVRLQFDRGLPHQDSKGNLLGRYYDKSNLDEQHFMLARTAQGRPFTDREFDAAYVRHGGKISTRPVKQSPTPRPGMAVWEWEEH